MQARAGDTLREMAPVRRLQRAGMGVRTRRDHVSAAVDQLTAGGKDTLPAVRRSRFDDDKDVGGQLPQPLQDRLPNVWGKFVQCVSQNDQIAWRTIDCRRSHIRDAPSDPRQVSACRKPLSPGAKNRARLHEQCIGELGPAVGRGPQRGPWAGADIERGVWCKIGAGVGDRGKARAGRRERRRQANREVGEGVFIAADVRPAVAPFFTIAL